MVEYYRVKIECDGLEVDNGNISLVANELYTIDEKIRYNIPAYALDKVRVLEEDTYFFFGARFEDGVSYNVKGV